MNDEGSYKIVRMYQSDDHPTETIRTGLTLEEAQAHCHDPATSSTSCSTSEGLARAREKGPWFDGYEEE